MLVLAVGCGGQVPGTPAGSEASLGGSVTSVDMCTILSDTELQELGQQLDTEDRAPDPYVGCDWLGDPLGLSLATYADETAADYLARPESFISIKPRDVNGRPGAELSVDPGFHCAQVMTVGSGQVQVGVRDASGLKDAVDECAVALRIAEMIELRLPEGGG